MGTYRIYAQNGGVIEFETGNDDYFDVGNGQLSNDIRSQGGLESAKVSLEVESASDISLESKTVIGVLQEQNFNKSRLELDRNTLLREQNVYLQNQQKILKATAQSSIRNTQAIIDSQDANTSMLNNLLESIEHLKNVIATRDSSVSVNASFDSSDITNVLNNISQNQNETNKKIVEGIQNQNKLNDKTLEKISQELDKNISYDGKYYNKIEIDKMAQTENLKNVSDENSLLLNDVLDVLDDFMTDGFDINANPFSFVVDNMKKEIVKEYENIKTQYNIKIGDI